jgi:hypothetical protein
MKKINLFLLLSVVTIGAAFAQKKPSSVGSSTYTSSIGVHLGEPFAVTYKQDMGKRAWEVSVGITNRSFGYGNYDYLRAKSRFDNHDIWSNSFSVMPTVQFHYLFQYDISALEGFKIFWGLGPQFRFRTYTATVHNRFFPFENTSRNGVDIDLGLDVTVGADYKFKKLPLAVFANVTPFFEFVDRFYVFPMGGVGARYTF